MEVVVKKYIQQTLIPWRPSSVSMNDLKLYIPIWLESSNNITHSSELEKQILSNKQKTNEELKNNLDYQNTLNMNNSTFYTSQSKGENAQNYNIHELTDLEYLIF
ncbi:unnamed protein product [Pneumocystis jirovecii]|uniref:Uncharacterized protein n=1 Tax=Pneumocystis jirovecii TaxID=42068 RepID=L0P8D4_PNEJI|nr:unnamed protein product [Pneumocystis jirovecii]